MHRVELKASPDELIVYAPPPFLMHRVELKVFFLLLRLGFGLVPNAPCGVERIEIGFLCIHHDDVPNAPCGVESPFEFSFCEFQWVLKFLMHRVELKAHPSSSLALQTPSFLMHRVELKAFHLLGKSKKYLASVPNAPCGVESYGKGHIGIKKFVVPNAPCGVESFCCAG